MAAWRIRECLRHAFFLRVFLPITFGFFARTFISECCFGGIRPSAAMSCLVFSRSLLDFAMSTDPARASSDMLLIVRAKAIQEYASLEQSLGKLFALLLGVSDEIAGIVFFRITTSRQRNQVIELLLQNKFGSTFDAYWHGLSGSPGVPRTPGLLALIRQLDDLRNKIVHWMPMTELGETTNSYLIRPNIWEYRLDGQSVTIAEIEDFIARANFALRSVNMFCWFNDPVFLSTSGLAAEHARTWHDIFQRPCTYPISNTHPLSPNYVEPPSPPQSSEA